MKTIKYISTLALAALALLGTASCSEDDLGPTIFPDTEDQFDPNS